MDCPTCCPHFHDASVLNSSTTVVKPPSPTLLLCVHQGRPWHHGQGDTDSKFTATSRRSTSMRSAVPGASGHTVVGVQCHMEQSAGLGNRSTFVRTVPSKWSAPWFPVRLQVGGGSSPPCVLGADARTSHTRAILDDDTKLRPQQRRGVEGSPWYACEPAPKCGAVTVDTDRAERFESGIKTPPKPRRPTLQGESPCMPPPASQSAGVAVFVTNDSTRERQTTLLRNAQHQQAARNGDAQIGVGDSAKTSSRPSSLEKVRNIITSPRVALFGRAPDPTRTRSFSLSSSTSDATSKRVSRPAVASANCGARSPSDSSRGPTIKSNTMATAISTSAVGTTSVSQMPVPATAVVTHTPEQALVDTATGRSTLEKMHDLLTTSLLPLDTGCNSVQSSPREARGAEANSAEAVTPPSLWVTRYVDKSTKYGLGFLLSDDSVGVRFNDGTAIVLEPGGIVFDYIQRARRGSSRNNAQGGRACRGGDEKRPTSTRHTLKGFPPRLQKKVHLLNRFRRHLQQFDDTDVEADIFVASRVASRAKAAPTMKQPLSLDGGSNSAQGQDAEPCLTFVERWRCTRKCCLFLLSDGTVQVRETSQLVLEFDAIPPVPQRRI